MVRYDRVLIDPSRDELFVSLEEAVEAANERRKLRLVRWPLPDLEALPDELIGPDGYLQVNGGEGPPRGGEGRSAVALAWWTDRAGRKHHRIVGSQGSFSRPMLVNMICPGDPRPPLWFVYPDHVYLIRHAGTRSTQAMCACGAHGSPEELGWMGTMCDTCHDLAEDGGTPSPAWLDPRDGTLTGEEGRSIFLAYSPDGRTLAAGTGRDHVVLWDTATGQQRGTLRAMPDDWLLGVAWIGDHLATASASGVLQRYSGRTGLPAAETLSLGPTECFALSPDGTSCLRGNRSGATLLSAEDKTPLRDLEGGLSGIGVAVFSPDGEVLAAGSRQGTLAVWEVATGKRRGTVHRPGAIVSGLAFSPDGETLAVSLLPAPGSSSPEAGRVLLWDVSRQAITETLPGHSGGTRCVGFAPDGRLLTTGGEDGLVRLWDVTTGLERLALEWHLDCVTAVAFAPDGLSLASAGFDGKVKLWPREILRPVARLREYIAGVS